MLQTLRYSMRVLIVGMVASLGLVSCIDEDLSECGKDYNINYSVKLHTNMSTEIQTELTTVSEQQVGKQLREVLADVFTDRASDIDLSFFTDDKRLAQHEQHIINASTAAFTLYLPIRRYENLSIANSAQEPLVAITGDDNLNTLALHQQDTDTIASHRIGLFTARQDIELEERDQEFHVDLYMQNCASCLVLDPGNTQPESVYGYADGFATDFNVADSTYSFNHTVYVRENLLYNNGLYALYAASFPSPDNKNVLPDNNADKAQSSAAASQDDDDAARNALWRIHVYVKLKNGSTTENILYVREPLRAGQLRIIKAKILDNGSITTTTQDVGVSVKLDWKPGGEHDIEI